jgi:hypothetical protein
MEGMEEVEETHSKSRNPFYSSDQGIQIVD